MKIPHWTPTNLHYAFTPLMLNIQITGSYYSSTSRPGLGLDLRRLIYFPCTALDSQATHLQTRTPKEPATFTLHPKITAKHGRRNPRLDRRRYSEREHSHHVQPDGQHSRQRGGHLEQSERLQGRSLSSRPLPSRMPKSETADQS